MRFAAVSCAVGIVFLWAGGPAKAQTLTFSLDRTGVPPERYSLRVDEASGRGTYHSDEPVSAGTAASPGGDVPVTVQPGTLKKLLAAVPLVESGQCETHHRNVAQTGAKTLRYQREGKVFECHYNYSDEERLNEATALFEAIGETMQYGNRLAAKLRFDRLGLDAEIDNLESALAGGQAAEVGNIGSVLQAIVNDDRVLDRVRRKAAHLLTGAGVSPEAQVPAGVGSSDR